MAFLHHWGDSDDWNSPGIDQEDWTITAADLHEEGEPLPDEHNNIPKEPTTKIIKDLVQNIINLCQHI